MKKYLINPYSFKGFSGYAINMIVKIIGYTFGANTGLFKGRFYK